MLLFRQVDMLWLLYTGVHTTQVAIKQLVLVIHKYLKIELLQSIKIVNK